MPHGQTDRLILLGTKGGPAIRTGGPSPSAAVIVAEGRPYVVDCGLGVTRGFVEAGFHLKSLTAIFITHHHSDHNLELGNLVHTAWTAGLATSVSIRGPRDTRRMMRDFLTLNRFDIETRISDEGRPSLGTLLHVEDYAEGLVFEDRNLRVTALRNHHPPIAESFALKFAWPGRTIVFSGDTVFLPALADFARDADVLVHEAMYLPAVDALVARVANGARLKQHLLDSHTSAEDAGRIASMACVGHLVLNHLVPADDPDTTPAHWETAVRTNWLGRLTVGHDGLVIPLD